LSLPAKKLATTDLGIAQVLVTRRLQELDARRRGIVLHGASRARVTLSQYASEHLVKKAETGKFNPRWLRLCELHLTRACEFFGAGRGEIPAYAYPLLATFLLTGGRRAEVCGLKVADVSFDHKTVRFRKNSSRKRLKTRLLNGPCPCGPSSRRYSGPMCSTRTAHRPRSSFRAT
jgi:integrase